MTVSRSITPRLLLRIRKGLRRLDRAGRPQLQPMSVDRAWHEMLARLDAEEEAERRLNAVEQALNGGSRH